MKVSIDFNEQTGVCVIATSGTVRRPSDSLTLLRMAGEAVQVHGASRILFDQRKTNIISTIMGAYETVSDPEKYGLNRSLRIAIVYSVITEDEQFMENVGVNRGATAFRIFDDMDAAWEWISK